MLNVYKNAKRPKTKARGTQKSNTMAHLEPNHSTKSIMDKEQSPKDTLTHFKKIYKTLWSVF